MTSREANGSLLPALRRTVRDWFVTWYWRTFVIPERCPCSWPIKSKRLIQWCGRMDDAYDRIEFRRSVGFIMALPFPLTNTTTSAGSNVNVTYTQTPRKRHGDKE